MLRVVCVTFLSPEKPMSNTQPENPRMHGQSGLWKLANQRKSRTYEQSSLSVVATLAKLSALS